MKRFTEVMCDMYANKSKGNENNYFDPSDMDHMINLIGKNQKTSINKKVYRK